MSRNTKIIGIVIIIVLFFAGLFVWYLSKFGGGEKAKTFQNNTIVFEQPRLKIFDETLYLNEFPDKILVHDSSVIVVKPERADQVTTVYDVNTKGQVDTHNDIVLDYLNKNFLYNKHGIQTFYNEKDLKIHCDKGFIQDTTRILCVTAKQKDPLDNKLISINPQTLEKHDLYSPQSLITAVYFANGVIYMGQTNIASKRTFLQVGDIVIPTPTQVDILFPLQGIMHYATLKSSSLQRQAAYYQIEKNNDLVLQETGRIVFYK